MGAQVGEHQHLARAHAQLVAVAHLDGHGERLAAHALGRDAEGQVLAHAADGAKVALQPHGGRAHAAPADEVGVVDAHALREPVFHQVVEQHQVLGEEHDAGRVALREVDGIDPLEAGGGGAHTAIRKQRCP